MAPALVGLAVAVAPLHAAVAAPDDEPSEETSDVGVGELGLVRLAGADRIATAVEVARATHPDGAATVYLARADDPADALVAGVLDGPVLLVEGCDVADAVVGEVARLDPDTVVALGGERAVCQDALDALAGERATARLAGPDRAATAAAIAAHAFPQGVEVVYLAASDRPDAVVAAGFGDGPVLLVDAGRAADATAQAIVDLGAQRVVVVGGTGVVPDEVVAEVAGDLPVARVAGSHRVATAVAVAMAANPDGSDHVVLARADAPSDAVVAGGRLGGPVLLVAPCDVPPPEVVAALADLGATRLTVLGGDGAVCDIQARLLSGAAAPAAPISAPEDPAALARHLAIAEALLRAGVADVDWLHALARTQQTAYRRLAQRPEVQPAALGALPDWLRPAAQEQVAAHTELASMVTTLRDEPPSTWRITEPTPLDELRAHYAEAEQRFGVPWNVLAAVHLVETRFSMIKGTSTAGAQGPMQFMPATWDAFGMGGDVLDDHDAIQGAANYLAHNGAPGNLAGALYAYNHDQRYVRAVTRHANLMAGDPDLLAAYHQWGIFYRTTSGELLLEPGWPDEPAQPVPGTQP